MKGLSASGIWVKSGQIFQLKRWARRMSRTSLIAYTTMGLPRIQQTVSPRNGMRYHGRSGRYHRISGIAGVRRVAGAEGGNVSLRRSRLVEELHLHARDFDQVVVVQRVRLRTERRAVERGVGRALHVRDEVA